MKLVPIVFAINLAIIGTGFWYANDVVDHEFFDVDQAVSQLHYNSHRNLLGIDKLKEKYPQTGQAMAIKEQSFLEQTVNKINAQRAADAAETAQFEAEEKAAKHKAWLAKGTYECTLYTAKAFPDGSSTKWEKTYSEATVTWNQNVPNAVELKGNNDAFKVENMQGAETSYFMSTKISTKDVEYEVDMSGFDINLLKVVKRTTYYDGEIRAELWACL